DEAGLVEARQPPRLHDRADLRDALAETELLHRRHQLQIESAVAAVAYDEIARPFPDQRIGRTAANRRQMREDLAHHRRLGRRVEPMATDDAAILKRKQVDGILIVVGIDLAPVRLA